MRKYTPWVVLSAAFLAVQGCHHCEPRPCPPDGAAAAYGPARIFHPLTPRAAVPAPPPGAVVYPPGTPPPVPAGIVPVQPPPGAFLPAQPAPVTTIPAQPTVPDPR